jgi:purine-nucleoside phosphorylase
VSQSSAGEAERVDALALALRRKWGAPPQITVVSGSGWFDLAAGALVAADFAPTADFPHWPMPRVPGHRAEIRLGELEGRRVAVVGGRVHAYEGRSAAEIVRGVRAMAAWGAPAVLLLNAAGSLDPARPPGSLLAVADHLNCGLPNPLCGMQDGASSPFLDLTELYDAAWRARLRARAPAVGEGIYAGVIGPSYETPAEVRALRALGADAVGMSTIPEALAARAAGMRVCALALLTNFAAGLSGGRPSHAEVLAAGAAHAAAAQSALRAALLEAPRGMA